MTTQTENEGRPTVLGSLTPRQLLERYGPALAVIALVVVLVATGPARPITNDTQVAASGARTTTPTDVGQLEETQDSVVERSLAAGSLPTTPVTNPAGHKDALAGTRCRADGAMFDYLAIAPPCVPVFKGDNGGATDQGVTAKTINIVAYYPKTNPAQEAALAAVGLSIKYDDLEVMIEAYRRYFNLHRETYGREVVVTRVDASGTDAASFKADAIRIAQQYKPFMVLPAITDLPRSFHEEINARGIICICRNSISRRYHLQYPGLQWSSLPTLELYLDTTAEYIIKRTRTGPAIYAGPPPPGETASYNASRRYGLVYLSSGTDGVPEPDFDKAATDFQQKLAANNIPLAAKIAYAFDVAQFQQQATNIIAQLKAAKVNNVILLSDFVFPITLTNEATRQRYNPEWMQTGFLLTNQTQWARLYDQDQWARSFGVNPLPVARVNNFDGPITQMITHMGFDKKYTNPIIAVAFMIFFDGLQYAGPRLTRKAWSDALFNAPPRTSTGYFARLKFTAADPVLFTDFNEVWYDRNARGPDENGKQGTGQEMYANGGATYTLGRWPSTAPTVFDKDPNPIAIKEFAKEGEMDTDRHPSTQKCRSCT